MAPPLCGAPVKLPFGKSLLLGDRGRLGMTLAILRVGFTLAGENAIAALGGRFGAELVIAAAIEVDPDHRVGAAGRPRQVGGSVESVGLRDAANGNSRQRGGQGQMMYFHRISPRDGLTNPSNIVS